HVEAVDPCAAYQLDEVLVALIVLGKHHLVVLAKNYQGYKNLIKLVRRAWVDGFNMRPRTDHDDLEKYHEGLIVCSACIAGEVPSKILKGDIKGAEESLLWHKRLFG
ncbi:PHP domain-containing protein, partial [Parabacteroides distasonis]